MENTSLFCRQNKKQKLKYVPNSTFQVVPFLAHFWTRNKSKITPGEALWPFFGNFVQKLQRVYTCIKLTFSLASDLTGLPKSHNNQKRPTKAMKVILKAKKPNHEKWIIFSCFWDHLVSIYCCFWYFQVSRL